VNWIESLEDRKLLSAVNLGGIIGPLKAGATYQYSTDLGGSTPITETDKVSTTTFHGKKALDIQKTLTLPGGAITTIDQYLAPTGAGQYVFGQIESGVLNTITTKYSPSLIQLPAKAVAGRAYTYHYTATQSTFVEATGQTTTTSYHITDKVMLVNSKPMTLQAGGQLYPVYVVSVDETSNGVSTHAESWFSPKIGLVQTSTDAGTTTLTSFTP